MGVSQPKPLHRFSPNFQGLFTPRASRADKVWGVSGNNCCHGNILIFSGLKVVGVPQPKPLQGYSPNFQDIFTPRGSTADLVLVGIRVPLLPWQHF